MFHVFYTYSKLQGSQTMVIFKSVYLLFYTYSKLQGSQTAVGGGKYNDWFYTYSKLQGSQTLLAAAIISLIVLHLFETTRFSNLM